VRTNIDIDDAVLDAAMRAGPYKTKKDAVEAGLRLLARQAAYREILKWEGKLRWEDHEDGDAAVASTGVPGATRTQAHEPRVAKRRHAGR
jgi:Arc/MetJ family transcription regulator